MRKTKKIQPALSVFKNREKEAKFWEDHFEQSWKTGQRVKATFAKNLSTTINVRLDPDVLDIVRNEAHKRGLGPTQIIRMWIMEKISKERSASVKI